MSAGDVILEDPACKTPMKKYDYFWLCQVRISKEPLGSLMRGSPELPNQNPACGSCRINANRRNPLRICDQKYSIVTLSPDQTFRGYTYVTYVNHETELYHLAKSERVGFFEEMVTIAQVLDQVFHPDKMNYSLLGNIGAAKGTGGHLHWHLTPRYRKDPLVGQPRCNPT